MNINSQNQIVTSNVGTNNPLLQLVSNSPQNNIMFYTQMNEEWTRGGGSNCYICGMYNLHIMPIDPRRQLSMCLDCYNIKIKLDNQIDQMLKPYRLTEEIFGSNREDVHTGIDIITIDNKTF